MEGTAQRELISQNGHLQPLSAQGCDHVVWPDRDLAIGGLGAHSSQDSGGSLGLCSCSAVVLFVVCAPGSVCVIADSSWTIFVTELASLLVRPPDVFSPVRCCARGSPSCVPRRRSVHRRRPCCCCVHRRARSVVRASQASRRDHSCCCTRRCRCVCLVLLVVFVCFC